MKKILFTVILLLSTAQSYAYGEPWDREMYAGVALNYAASDFEKDFGKDLLSEQLFGANFTAGFRINELFAVELDYIYLQSRKNNKDFQQGALVLGDAVISFSEIHSSKYHLRGLGSGVSVFTDYLFDEVQLLAHIGIAKLTPKIKHTHVASKISANSSVFNINKSSTFTGKSKIIPRVGVGFHYMLSEEFAIRGSAMWYNTAKFKNISGGLHTAKMKNMVNFSIGVLWFI